MKSKIALLAIIGFMLFAAFSVAQEQNKGSKDIDLSGGTKGNIPFPHFKHQEVLKDCNICHKDFPQTAGSIEKLKAEGKLEKKQIMNKHCVKCHKEKENAGEKTGPVSCSKCHQGSKGAN